MATISAWIDFGDCGEHEVTVEYDYSKGFKGTYWQPPEPAEITINQIIWKGLDVLDMVSDSKIDSIKDEIWAVEDDRNLPEEYEREAA